MELKGKVCVLTGATSGIGREAAKEMAVKEAILVLPVRNMEKGEALRKEILALTPNATIDLMYCDLASFASIRDFVLEFLTRYDSLNLLVNNAGVWERTRRLSEDGIEMNFAVNHLAPFLLTNLLTDILQSGVPARIINTSSEAHRYSTINFSDLEFADGYSTIKSYAQSKLANILFTKKLSQRMRGSGITVNCFHPGMVATGLFEKFPKMLIGLMRPFMISPEAGAQTLIYLATSHDLENASGGYYARKKLKKPTQEALRKDIADKLWEISENYVGL